MTCADALASCRKAMSVLKVEYPDTMDETKTRVKIGGLLDPRLGTIGSLKIYMLVLIHL
jgi:DNA-directed RNA polymerase beta' subunit